MLHLKASQRYPTQEYAFALLHDCLTAATLAQHSNHMHLQLSLLAVPGKQILQQLVIQRRPLRDQAGHTATATRGWGRR